MNASNAAAWRGASAARKQLRYNAICNAILDSEGRATIRTLGAILGLDHTTLHSDLNQLERMGRVKRTPISQHHIIKAKTPAYLWSLT